MIQFQTDPHRMPIEGRLGQWPEHRSPFIPVAKLRLPVQEFNSKEQLAFAGNLSFKSWHSLADHRPLGNQNRARKAIYLTLSKFRQSMNEEARIEPTGNEVFDNGRERTIWHLQTKLPATGGTKMAKPKPKLVFLNRSASGARPDMIDFRDITYVPTLIKVPPSTSLKRYRKIGDADLGSRTGGSLHGIRIGYLSPIIVENTKGPRRTRRKKFLSGPAMLYAMAKRIDEWPGDEYEG